MGSQRRQLARKKAIKVASNRWRSNIKRGVRHGVPAPLSFRDNPDPKSYKPNEFGL